ncbi:MULTISPECIES: ATP-binding protein [Trichocoleus]|uniref:histidine kinase n=1 Tax=Trichocoleus desertorum GB2-A4 TaxID=2933944 RepID=A0ABV0J7R1_9CYAN|nr:ATP-binding protein [Trichocoleus sp. FACHB-46]MBD1863418.1 response regulator [Trichocoleus sp. FACHB-46]
MTFPSRWVQLNPSRSLQARLGLATGGIVLLLSILLSWLVGYTTSVQLQNTQGQSLAELAYQMADKLDRGMFERYREIQILAALPPIREATYSQPARRSLLEKLQSTFSDYAWIALIDPQGNVLTSTGGILEGVSVASRDVFQQGRNKTFVGDVHDAVMLAKLLPHPNGEPLRFLDLAAPVLSEQGQFQGVIAAHLSWAWAEEVKKSLLEPLGQHSQVEIFVLSTDGKVLLGPDALQGKTLTVPSVQKVQANQNHYLLESWAGEGKFLTGFARAQGYRDYPGLDWLVLVRQKAEVALAPARKLQRQILGLGLICGVGFALLSWLSASRIVDPMLEIAAIANRMRQGDQRVPIPLLEGRDELAKLSQSLRYLVSTLNGQQEALYQSEEQYRLLSEALPQFVWLLDPEGQVEYCNRYWYNYTGLSEAQTLGCGWEVALHPEDYAHTRRQWRQATKTGDPCEIEYRMRSATGEYRWYLASLGPAHDQAGRIIKWVGTAIDIEARKRVEVERSELLNREKTAREQAETANQLKDEFLAVLSHELRSPLNPILGWAKLLRTRQFDPETTDQALETIERNAKLQAQLVEDLLDVSRILQGKLSLNVATVNLATTIQSAIETVRLAATAKSIQIHAELDQWVGLVAGDANRLQQVVWNLLSNAVKFTPAGGNVEVRLEAIAPYAQIQVIDTGRGIRPEFLPHVFDHFRQADSSTTRQFGGLGLGLAIVRQVVELHGGTVQVDSLGEGMGATFTVRLPMMQAATETEPQPSLAPEETSLEGIRVLVVDDEADMRTLASTVLKQAGAEVKLAASASEALAVLRQSGADVLVSDIGMSEMDGYRLIRQVRTIDQDLEEPIPAIALTAYAADSDQKQALSAGFQKHLAKPVEPDELIQAIATLVKPKASR